MPRDLSADAARLRELHVAGQPVLLANAWDPPSARLVEELGFDAVATSSAAVAECAGYPDNDTMPPEVAFGAISRVAAATQLPVTADCEAGYRLAPAEFVERLLASGAVGCNIEDTDHHHGTGGPRRLVDADAHAERLRSIKDAARSQGVDIVLNARVDTVVAGIGDDELFRRARLYRDAGADCIYPIVLADLDAVARVVETAEVVNVLYRSGSPTMSEFAGAGAARISVGSSFFRHGLAKVKLAMAALRAGTDEEVWK